MASVKDIRLTMKAEKENEAQRINAVVLQIELQIVEPVIKAINDEWHANLQITRREGRLIDNGRVSADFEAVSSPSRTTLLFRVEEGTSGQKSNTPLKGIYSELFVGCRGFGGNRRSADTNLAVDNLLRTVIKGIDSKKFVF